MLGEQLKAKTHDFLHPFIPTDVTEKVFPIVIFYFTITSHTSHTSWF